ncbi:unnamed protein product, partial [Prorocentrum cordatum]
AVANMFVLGLMMTIWSSTSKPRSTLPLQERLSLKPSVQRKVMPAMRKLPFRLLRRSESCENSLPQYARSEPVFNNVGAGPVSVMIDSNSDFWQDNAIDVDWPDLGFAVPTIQHHRVFQDIREVIDSFGLRTSVVMLTAHAHSLWEKLFVSQVVRSWMPLNAMLEFNVLSASPLMKCAELMWWHSSRK